MNKNVLQGNWKQLTGSIKEQWGKLTDNDIAEVEGNFDQLVGKIQERYGYERSKAEHELNEWMKEH